jgi:hypothetical protein
VARGDERTHGTYTAWLTLAGLVVAAIAARLWLAGQIPTPWIMVDEIIYSELAKSISEGATLHVREQPSGFYSLLYPLLIAPAWWAATMATTYEIAKALNVVVMSLAAVPVFLWARRLVPVRLALVVAGLVLLMPSFLYTGTLMTENAFLPAFLLAAFATAVALERPTRSTQGLALLAIALACAVRLQGLVLFGVYATAVAVKLVLDRRAGERPDVRPYWFSAAGILVIVGVVLGTTVARGEPLVANLGAYQAAADAGYSVGDTARWTLYHAAELGLAVAFVPLSAFLALLVLAWRRGADSAERSLLAVTAAAVPWLVVSVAVFASRNSLRVEERYLFYLVPLLLLALGVWLERGRPRTVLAAVSAAVPLVLVVALPLGRLVNVDIYADTFAFHPLFWLEQEGVLGKGEVRALVLGVAAAAAVLFALVPLRPARFVLPALVGAIFLATQIAVFDVVRGYSETLDDVAELGSPSWLDDELGRDRTVAFVWTGVFDPSVLWQLEFWNRNLDVVYRLAPEPGSLPAAEAEIEGATGRLLAPAGFPDPEVILTDYQLQLSEEPARRFPRGLYLYEVRPSTRIVARAEGVSPDGWAGERFAVTRFGCGPRGWLGLALASDPALGLGEQTVVARQGGRELARGSIGPGEETFLRVPVTGTDGSCTVDVEVAPTAIPAEVIPGSPDTRRLGLKL